MVRIYENRVELLRSGVLPHNAVCAEVGVFCGTFSKLILEHAAPERLHLIDIWADVRNSSLWCPSDKRALDNITTVSRDLSGHIKAGRVSLHQGWSIGILSLFPAAYFDWLYLDADHSFQGCSADLLAAEPKVKPGGMLAGHDYGTPEQGKGMKYYYPGVTKAVDLFCETRGWHITYLTEQGEYAEPDAGGRNAPSYVLERNLEC